MSGLLQHDEDRPSAAYCLPDASYHDNTWGVEGKRTAHSSCYPDSASRFILPVLSLQTLGAKALPGGKDGFLVADQEGCCERHMGSWTSKSFMSSGSGCWFKCMMEYGNSRRLHGSKSRTVHFSMYFQFQLRTPCRTLQFQNLCQDPQLCPLKYTRCTNAVV